jgi:xylitol oxidase
MQNWAGNVTFGAERFHRPSSVAEVQDIVAGSRRVRAIGTGHSFSPLADTTGDLVSLAGLPPVMDIDGDHRRVRVSAGVRYGELAAHLNANGYSLHNLGSLPHISVAGAVATGTHGSGVANGNLSSAVTTVEFVAADGTLHTVDSGDDDFAGTVVGLGAVGVVTSLTLTVGSTFDIQQYVYDNLPRAELDGNFDEIVAAGYSVSLFTDWAGPRINQVWVKRLPSGDAPPEWVGATLADGPRHPIDGMPTENCTEQLGVPGPWHTRLPHFRLEFTPSSGEELQSEYFVPSERAVEALAALDGIADRIASVLQISEIRTIASDRFWLSPCYDRDSVAFHFTWVKDAGAVAPVLADLEERLAPFAARPHWGKVFSVGPDELRQRYERLGDFADLMGRRDPDGKFRNAMLDRYLPG